MPRRRRRRVGGRKLPKGAYPLPDDGYVFNSGRGSGRAIQVRPVYHDEPDVKAIARVLVQLVEEMDDNRDQERK
mgnify:CR=1 FL=1